MAASDFTNLKQQVLEKRRKSLYDKYQAANVQLDKELSAVNKVTIKNQIEDIEQEILEVDAELDKLERKIPRVDLFQNRKQLLDDLANIDFQQAWEQVRSVYENHLDRNGGAALFLLPESENKCADLCIRRIRKELQQMIDDYSKVICVPPVEIQETDALTSDLLLRRLSKHFHHEPLNTSQLIAKMCNKLDKEQVLLVELNFGSEFYRAEGFLNWFLNEFWLSLVNELLAQKRLARKCIFVATVAQIIPTEYKWAERYCLMDEFCAEQKLKFIPLPMTNWSVEEIQVWLRRYTKLNELDDVELSDRANSIYTRSQQGIPTYALNKLYALLDEHTV